MSATRLLLLGTVRIFQPVHGYFVRRELMSWHADSWANLNPGSVYNGLRSLARDGILGHTFENESRTWIKASHSTPIRQSHIEPLAIHAHAHQPLGPTSPVTPEPAVSPFAAPARALACACATTLEAVISPLKTLRLFAAAAAVALASTSVDAEALAFADPVVTSGACVVGSSP